MGKWTWILSLISVLWGVDYNRVEKHERAGRIERICSISIPINTMTPRFVPVQFEQDACARLLNNGGDITLEDAALHRVVQDSEAVAQ